MRSVPIIVAVLIGLSMAGARAQSTPRPAAQVFGIALACADVQGDEPGGCATGLLRHVRAEVSRDFIDRNALQATDAELERLTAYNQAFERHDRTQRTRKLAELEARLASGTLVASERQRLEAFRRVLARLAAYEADLDAGVETRASVDEKTLRAWIETAKLNKALYARYGGVIAVETYGPRAHGAMQSLIHEHVERGNIRILDADVAAVFFRALDAPPPVAHVGGEPDFTPFWERPIPASYMPRD